MINPYNIKRYKDKKNASGVAGIYFLFKKEELVYIGKSNNIRNRLRHGMKHPKYDSFSFLEFSHTEISQKEKDMIFKYQPKINKIYKTEVKEKIYIMKKQTKDVHLYIKPDLFKKLKAAAVAERRSMTCFVTMLIEKALQQ